MSRRREKIDVSMFPFLSVLCAVIGVMVLFIVLIFSTRVIEVEERYKEKENSAKKPKPGTPGGKITGIDKPTHSKLGLELGRLRQLFSERKAQLEVLQRKLEGLEALLENKKTDLFVKVRRSPLRELAPPTDVHMVEKRGYQIVPRGGHKVSLNPVFVEVKSEGYAMYPSRKQFPASVAKRSDDDSSSESVVDVKLAEFLRRVNTRRKREYLVFLIHPNGVTAYRNIRGYLYEKNYDQVRVGWEPFSRNWILTNAEQ